ncbi:MAG: response regulator [Thermodesulfobacteriota bacterium]|nr:response regulator [Thermodesulfobacteriota bacterium]
MSNSSNTTVPSPEPAPPRVLMVDDEADFLNAVSRRLAKRGISPVLAGSGEEGLALLAETPMDVAVLDVKMPGMGGLEALRRIKGAWPDMEVILLTGNVSAADGVEGIKQGAFDYITKPIEIDHLAGKIRQAWDKRRRKREQEEQQRFQEKMEQQMTAMDRLASLGTLSTGVAHEINNPLAMMREAAGYMRLVLEKDDMAQWPGKSGLAKGIEKIEKGIERIRRITHLLLGFVRPADQACARTDLKELISESIELVTKEMQGKQIAVDRKMDDTEGVAWTDPYALRQVMINLLTNAVHAIQREGTITVSLSEAEGFVSIAVSDTGVGIPGENLDKIFEPFFSTKPSDKGTGLGLYVTRGIVDRLDGRIGVKSTVGRGTTFTVEIPVCRRGDAVECVDENTCDEILTKIKEIGGDDEDTRESTGG